MASKKTAEISEATLLRVKKGDILQILIKSDDVDDASVTRVREKYQTALDNLHGVGTTKVLVFGVGLTDTLETVIIRVIRKD